MAAGLTTVVLAGAWQMSSSGERAFERISKDLEVEARWAPVQERLVRDLRRARAFRTPGGGASPVLLVTPGRAGAAEEELRFTAGRIVRVAGPVTTVVAGNLPIEDLSFEALHEGPGAAARLLVIRARLAWTDATGRSSTLATQTRVMARNAPLGALQLEEEVAE